MAVTTVRMIQPVGDRQTARTFRAAAHLALAAACLVAAIMLLRLLPLRAVLACARAAARLMRRHPAAGAAAQLAAGRDWATARWPGRAACLENSLASYLAAAVLGYHASWRIGCRFAPAACHAWTQTCLGLLGEPIQPDRPLHTTVAVGHLLNCENLGDR
ncbi:lasso peptide biosynthesis B2 protein [Nonomuraea sp. NPDC004354]